MKEQRKESRYKEDRDDYRESRRKDDRDNYKESRHRDDREDYRESRHRDDRDEQRKEKKNKEDHKRKRKHKSSSQEPKEKRHRRERDEYERSPHREVEKDLKHEPMEVGDEENGGGHEKLSLSVEETNKLRAKLGLKPLQMNDGKDNEDKSDVKESIEKQDVHVPAVNIGEVKKREQLKEKLQLMKDKRRLEKTLLKTKPLAEQEEEAESAIAWVEKSRKLEAERKQAEERAKLLDQMDQEFGVTDLVEKQFLSEGSSYRAKDLKGLKIEHSAKGFKEGTQIILTLKDKGVLDESEDVLVNVNMVDDENAAKNVENKKNKPDYNPYDEPEWDESGNLIQKERKEILSKYEDEIRGGPKKDYFVIGNQGRPVREDARSSEIVTKLKPQSESLKLAEPVVASEYYTTEEMVQFKKSKPKAKKSLRKKVKLTADDLLASAGVEETLNAGAPKTNGSSNAPKIPGLDLLQGVLKKPDVDDDEDDDLQGPDVDLAGEVVEEDTAQLELELALKRARNLSTRKSNQDSFEKILDAIKSEPVESNDASLSGNTFVMNSTSEFCRNLGDISTIYAGSNPYKDEDDDENMMENIDDDSAGRGWQSVEIDEKPVEIKLEESHVLDDEPVIDQGIAAALKLASKKGYLEQRVVKPIITTPRQSKLEAQNYSIEDKKMDDMDDKYSGRRHKYSAGGGGPTVEFREKEGYKPEIKLEYVDDQGKEMSKKEAFRYLSHRFHGKGSGKKKMEKRMKKAEEDVLMRSMSSTDTPLNTVQLLHDKQRLNRQPYVILSGGKGLITNNFTKH